jgi:hypothetical protein
MHNEHPTELDDDRILDRSLGASGVYAKAKRAFERRAMEEGTGVTPKPPAIIGTLQKAGAGRASLHLDPSVQLRRVLRRWWDSLAEH